MSHSIAIARFAACVLCLFAACSRVDAQTIVYGTLAASLDDGSLAGTTFSVVYSYDADQVSDVGESYVTLNSFDFTLLGVPFTRNDIFQGGQVIFLDGVLENVTASFQVILPPDSPVNNITFGFGEPLGIAYIDLNGDFGSGSFAPCSDENPCNAASPWGIASAAAAEMVPLPLRANGGSTLALPVFPRNVTRMWLSTPGRMA
jgi:hypothetical protein